jgi:sulfite reductase (NADPH) flavoprotein alpha-component
MTPSLNLLRWALLLGLCLAYAAICLAPWWRRRMRMAAAQDESGSGAVWVVAYASQTGSAEELAGQAAALLRLAGIMVRLCSMSELGRDELMRSAASCSWSAPMAKVTHPTTLHPFAAAT